jgi:ParB family transcriptional regulator, chromosome partitioning protein
MTTMRVFDKSIITLKLALDKIRLVISQIENNWITYEILMQHKNMLHAQIDLLIKEKKKKEKYRKVMKRGFLGRLRL